MLIIGEATTRLSERFKHLYPNIEWRVIQGFRNLIVHEYFRINWKIVWEIISDHLLKFKEDLIQIKG